MAGGAGLMPVRPVSREHGPIALGFHAIVQTLDRFRGLQSLVQGAPKCVAPLRGVVDPRDRLDFDQAWARLPDGADVPAERTHRS